MKVLIGKKIGMTQLFREDTGASVPVTLIKFEQNYVAHTSDKAGHTIIEIGAGKKSSPNQAETGKYKALGFVPRKTTTVNVTKETKFEAKEVGSELNQDIFEVNEVVEVTGVTKGKGFQGVMKRWGFKGGKKTHGQSDRDRAPGSIGSGTTLGRVFKGQKMAGRAGRIQQTVKGLKIVVIDPESNTIAVSGSVPGNADSTVVVKSYK